MTAGHPASRPALGDERLRYGTQLSSFSEHLRLHAPDLLPENRFDVGRSLRTGGEPMNAADLAPHGTTIVAVSFDGGVVLAGDRRATMGNMIASRDVEKVYVTDDYSAAGIAGTAGVAIELVRLFAVELEHYEKIEGVPLTFDGKANRLSSMVRGNLGAAMQGLAVVPLLVGFDLDAADLSKAGRIVSYDVVGGRYEERAGYHAVGSGSLFAKSALKKTYDPRGTEEDALRAAIAALYDAADDDSATGGPDMTRGIYPTAVVITADGAVEVASARAAELARDVVAARTQEAGDMP
ncbi:proteasome subunit beta [Rhodococcus tukisamuensis]|uniref:Proteasome subunit beta n=1 Tax=Rhodococcus tukisamuensis TaxID=168276 RepID=A0A1G6UB07_9NOCA|nr:proteasome subunit beta [Rhodococcus tukisamuensis]SDD37876.1 proteasome beta subunit [Rhodococcus tukisamuensis]